MRAPGPFCGKRRMCGQMADFRAGNGLKGIAFREGIPLYLDKQASGLIEPTGTLGIWRAVWADLGHDPTDERRYWGSRMPHTSKLWRFEAMTHIPYHDTPSQAGRRKAAEVSPVERSSQPPPVAHIVNFI